MKSHKTVLFTLIMSAISNNSLAINYTNTSSKEMSKMTQTQNENIREIYLAGGCFWELKPIWNVFMA